MISGTGNVTMNGITDAELVMILQIKEKHEASIDFHPGQMKNAQTQSPTPKKFYNEVRLDWRGEDGLRALFQIVEALLAEKKHEPQP
jgi:hypothetical protein